MSRSNRQEIGINKVSVISPLRRFLNETTQAGQHLSIHRPACNIAPLAQPGQSVGTSSAMPEVAGSIPYQGIPASITNPFLPVLGARQHFFDTKPPILLSCADSNHPQKRHGSAMNTVTPPSRHDRSDQKLPPTIFDRAQKREPVSHTLRA